MWFHSNRDVTKQMTKMALLARNRLMNRFVPPPLVLNKGEYEEAVSEPGFRNGLTSCYPQSGIRRLRANDRLGIIDRLYNVSEGPYQSLQNH